MGVVPRMKFGVSLIVTIVAYTYAYAFAAGASLGDCCEEKTVGDVTYRKIGVEDTSTYGCESGCTYEKVGYPGSKYCFKKGELPVRCVPPGPICPGPKLSTCQADTLFPHCQIINVECCCYTYIRDGCTQSPGNTTCITYCDNYYNICEPPQTTTISRN